MAALREAEASARQAYFAGDPTNRWVMLDPTSSGYGFEEHLSPQEADTTRPFRGSIHKGEGGKVTARVRPAKGPDSEKEFPNAVYVEATSGSLVFLCFDGSSIKSVELDRATRRIGVKTQYKKSLLDRSVQWTRRHLFNIRP